MAEAFDEFRRRAGTYSNRALFEVPIILESCLQKKSFARLATSDGD